MFNPNKIDATLDVVYFPIESLSPEDRHAVLSKSIEPTSYLYWAMPNIVLSLSGPVIFIGIDNLRCHWAQFSNGFWETICWCEENGYRWMKLIESKDD